MIYNQIVLLVKMRVPTVSLKLSNCQSVSLIKPQLTPPPHTQVLKLEDEGLRKKRAA